MKKIFFSLALCSLVFSNTLNADGILAGDTKLACEAILCLSSGTRPSECTPSINKYFSIKHKKWDDTVNARRNFLRLCPVDGADAKDPAFANLRDNILPNVDSRKCTADYINSNPEKKCIKENCGERRCSCDEYAYKPATKMPIGCQALIKHAYTNIKPVNTCKTTRWYSQNEWRTGKVINSISKDEFLKRKEAGVVNLSVVNNNSKLCRHNPNLNFCQQYFSNDEIKKDCWINQDN